MNNFIFKKIGFIGAGNMAKALISGLIDSGTVKPENIFATNRTEGKLLKLESKYGIKILKTNEELVEECDVVFLTVKPQDLPTVLDSLGSTFDESQLVISLAAGTPLNYLNKWIPKATVVRVMTNTPIFICKAVVGYCHNGKAEIYEKYIEGLFSPLGYVVKLEEGEAFEALTVASASGTGFIFELMQYWQEWIEEHGVNESIAKEIVINTFVGSALLAQHEKETPLDELQNRVTSKKGGTAVGLEAMRDLELDSILRMSFNKSEMRFKEISQGK